MKIFKTILLLFAFSVLSFSQTITLTSPNGGENWKIGGLDQNITWSSSGISGGKFKIMLWEGSLNLGTIVANLSHTTNSYSWETGKLSNGTTVPDGSNYRIKIRLQGESPADFSDASFSLSKLHQITPHSQMQKISKSKIVTGLHAKRIILFAPQKGSNWTETGTYTIHWKSTLKPKFTIELYNYNGKKKIKTIRENALFVGLSNDKNYRYNWTIPLGTYDWPGNFTIRVSSEDGKEECFSKMFHIDKAINMVEKKYTIQGTINNRAHRHYRSKISGLDKFGRGFPAGPEPGIMKVGYDNYWKQWGPANIYHRHLCFIFRSFANFDVTDFSQKKIIKKAVLHLKKINTHYSDGHSVNNNDPGHCIKGLYHVDQPWSSPFDVTATRIGGIETYYDITGYVRDWALKGGNHGLMLVGMDESYKKNNATCITYYTCSLEITTLENQL